MKAQTMHWRPDSGWLQVPPWVDDTNIVIYFGTTPDLDSHQPYLGLRALFPRADLLGCSTGSQIVDTEIIDEGVTAVALNFERVQLRCVHETLAAGQSSEALGQQLAQRLMQPDLRAVLAFCDGLLVNGSQLVTGLFSVLGEKIPLFGGLAGDGARFERTLVGLNAPPALRQVALVGLYGDALRISHGAAGGWDPYGPQRVITASHGNVLQQLDGRPALDLYERQLGDKAKDLPGGALNYPLCIWHEDLHPEPLVRTVLGINSDERSMVFAGDMPVGWSAQLMRASHERLVAGAAAAAYAARFSMDTRCVGDTFALLVSCIGRRLLMGHKAIDEVAAVNDILGPGIIKLGYYSYGGIAPREVGGRCLLHNQTLITALIGEAFA